MRRQNAIQTHKRDYISSKLHNERQGLPLRENILILTAWSLEEWPVTKLNFAPKISPYPLENRGLAGFCPKFNPSKSCENASKWVKIIHRQTNGNKWNQNKKSPEIRRFRGFVVNSKQISALGELGSATGCLETVLCYRKIADTLDFQGFRGFPNSFCPTI